MTLYNLAKKIAEWVWNNGDRYELRDCYDSYEDFESETIMGMSNAEQRKGIAHYLRFTTFETEEDDAYASKLWGMICDYERGIAK